jgi:hypothetical protein
MVHFAVTTYTLVDHLTTPTPLEDEEWVRLDSIVLRWLYGSVA